jgi:hypothetical protein
MTTDKEHFTRVLNKLTEGGLLPRGKTSDLVAEYDGAVQQIADEDKAAADAENAQREAAALADAIDTDPERDTIELTDADVTLDDEPTTVGTRKRGKLKV